MKLSEELGQRLWMDFSDTAPGWLSASEEQFEGGQGLGRTNDNFLERIVLRPREEWK